MGTRLMFQLLRSCLKINDWLATVWLLEDITARLRYVRDGSEDWPCHHPPMSQG